MSKELSYRTTTCPILPNSVDATHSFCLIRSANLLLLTCCSRCVFRLTFLCSCATSSTVHPSHSPTEPSTPQCLQTKNKRFILPTYRSARERLSLLKGTTNKKEKGQDFVSSRGRLVQRKIPVSMSQIAVSRVLVICPFAELLIKQSRMKGTIDFSFCRERVPYRKGSRRSKEKFCFSHNLPIAPSTLTSTLTDVDHGRGNVVAVSRLRNQPAVC